MGEVPLPQALIVEPWTCLPSQAPHGSKRLISEWWLLASPPQRPWDPGPLLRAQRWLHKPLNSLSKNCNTLSIPTQTGALWIPYVLDSFIPLGLAHSNVWHPRGKGWISDPTHSGLWPLWARVLAFGHPKLHYSHSTAITLQIAVSIVSKEYIQSHHSRYLAMWNTNSSMYNNTFCDWHDFSQSPHSSHNTLTSSLLKDKNQPLSYSFEAVL